MKILMKHIQPIVFALFLIGISACNNPPVEKEVQYETVYKINNIAGDEIKSVALLEIEGMSCEKMCVGIINKTIKNINGVVATNLEFESDRNTNICEVEFSNDKLQPKQIVDAIQAIANGQYAVKSVDITHFVLKKEATTLDDETSLIEEPENSDFRLSSTTIPRKVIQSDNSEGSDEEEETETPGIKIPQITLPNILTLITSLLQE